MFWLCVHVCVRASVRACVFPSCVFPRDCAGKHIAWMARFAYAPVVWERVQIIYPYVFMYIHAYIRTYVHIYTHKHTHTQHHLQTRWPARSARVHGV